MGRLFCVWTSLFILWNFKLGLGEIVHWSKETEILCSSKKLQAHEILEFGKENHISKEAKFTTVRRVMSVTDSFWNIACKARASPPHAIAWMHVVKKGCSLLSHFLYGHFERYRGTPQRIYQSNRTCTCERPKTQSSLQCLMTFTCRNYDDGCNICVQNFCFSILWSLLKHCIQFAFSDPVNSFRTHSSKTRSVIFIK